VAAASKNQYFLSFLYSADTRTFGYIAVANGGRESKENSYSRLDSKKPIFNLSLSRSGEISVEGEMLEGNYLEYYPYSFPEFNDVEGTTTDYSLALSVGSDLTKSLNNAVSFILKPVSTAGRKDLGLELSSNVYSLAVALSNSGYDSIANNRTTFKKFEYAGKLT